MSGFLTLSDFESHIQGGHSEEVLFTNHLRDEKYSVETKSEPLIAMTSPKEKASKVPVNNPYHGVKRSLPCPNDPDEFKSKQTNPCLVTNSNSKPKRSDDSITRVSGQNKHLLNHSGRKVFVCDQCDKGFTQKSTLNTHLLIHKGVKSFVCNHCNKGFSQKSTLRGHLLIHTGKKPYVCDHCNKGFSHKTNLKSHLLTHTGVKPFLCNHCNKGFSLKGNLQKHLKKHS